MRSMPHRCCQCCQYKYFFFFALFVGLIIIPHSSWALTGLAPGNRIVSTNPYNYNDDQFGASHNNNNDNNIIKQQPAQENAEVIGANGRIGSLLLSSSLFSNNNNNNNININKKTSRAVRAVPRGIAPGCLSPKGCPIFVATPAKAWPQILHDTPLHRRDDLVWIGNGIPPLDAASSGCELCTVVVPHFGVLQVNAPPVTTPESPPTFVFGKHASMVQEILKSHGIDQIVVVSTLEEIWMAAARKLLWAASMWLLCHDNTTFSGNSNKPRTALQIHTKRAQELDALIRHELVPALNVRLAAISPTRITNDDKEKCTFLPKQDCDCDAVLDYLYQYSKSMPTAIPNLSLAMSEWKERNAFFLQARDVVPQPFHEALLQRVGGISQDMIKQQQQQQEPKSSSLPTTTPQRIKVEIPALDLTVIGTQMPSHKPIQSVIVVGAGILGSSISLHLARQGITNVTVVDLQQSDKDLGKTTPASWAWLNANGKSPPAYAWLNQMGMDAWRKDPVLAALPTWSGALVRFQERQSIMGGYRYEGPLDKARLEELEPAADLWDTNNGDQGSTSNTSTFTYYYPDEGLVDPARAVIEIRKAAVELGVQFLGQCKVTAFTKDNGENGAVSGIVVVDTTRKSQETTRAMKADVVVLAAGMGMADLGNIPLLHRPGQIAFARPQEKTSKLQRIVVDTVRASHVLQRDDGTIVVGGGALEVGGDGAAALSTTGYNHEEALSADNSLLATAKRIFPGVIGDLYRTERALRPIPQDGLPAVGFIEPGLYATVSHSGVTLSPILGGLVASELANGISVETLEPFRPSRFFYL